VTVIASLTAQNAHIFRIVHRDNLGWLLDNGLHCRTSHLYDPNYVEIGNPDLIDKRQVRAVPIWPGGTLSDYIPFYFTPRSLMLYNIKTGWNGLRQRSNSEILILVSNLRRLRNMGQPFIFTDQHAYTPMANFYHDLDQLDRIDWTILQNSDFAKDLDDLAKPARYQAEALIHGTMPVAHLAGIACCDAASVQSVQAQLAARNLSLGVVARPRWYF